MHSPAVPLGHAMGVGRVEAPIQAAMTVLFLADAAFVALFLLFQFTGSELDTLSVAAERSLPTWYASTKLFLVGQVLAVATFFLPHPARSARLALLGLAALFVLLSIDEIASLHERLGWRLNAWLAGDGSQADLLFARTGYWMAVLLPLALGALAFLGHAYARASRPGGPVVSKALLGCALLLGGAARIEASQNFVPDGPQLGIAIAVEEGCELVGVTFLLWAALGELARHAGWSGTLARS